MRRLLIACGFASLALAVAGLWSTASAAGNKKDPLPSFTFAVLVKGEGETFFRSCSGLKVETEVVEIREGGENGAVRKIPGRVKWTNLVLKRNFIGQVQNDPMQQWVRAIIAGQDVRKDITVVIINQDQVEVGRYEFHRCFPVTWDAGIFFASPRDPASLDSKQDGLLTETIELAHEGMEKP